MWVGFGESIDSVLGNLEIDDAILIDYELQ